jgi:hypothetical protein
VGKVDLPIRLAAFGVVDGPAADVLAVLLVPLRAAFFVLDMLAEDISLLLYV